MSSPLSKSLQICGFRCEEGQKKYEEIVIDDSDSARVTVPLMLVNGVKEGPTLCITAGMYGLEYPGIEAAIRTFNKVDPRLLQGSLIILPVMNMPSFQWRTLGKSPVDMLDLNRVFPGTPNGSMTQYTAYVIFNEVVMKSDYHIDLRGGDIDESHMTHMIVCRTGNSQLDRVSFDMARSLGLEYIMVHDSGKEGATDGILLQEATKRGKPSIISEIGIGLATYLEEDIALTERGLENLMRHLKMLPGTPNPFPRVGIMRDRSAVKCTKGGIFYPSVLQSGPYFTQLLKTGEKIGEVKNLKGEVLEELFAGADGVLHELLPRRVVNRGDTVLLIRTIEDQSKYYPPE